MQTVASQQAIRQGRQPGYSSMKSYSGRRRRDKYDILLKEFCRHSSRNSRLHFVLKNWSSDCRCDLRSKQFPGLRSASMAGDSERRRTENSGCDTGMRNRKITQFQPESAAAAACSFSMSPIINVVIAHPEDWPLSVSQWQRSGDVIDTM